MQNAPEKTDHDLEIIEEPRNKRERGVDFLCS